MAARGSQRSPELSAYVQNLISRGREELAKGDQAAATKSFAAAVEAADKVDERLAMRQSCSQSTGVYLLRMGRARESIEHLNQALPPVLNGGGVAGDESVDRQSELESGRTLYCLAMAHASVGEHADAIGHFKKALAIFKKHKQSELEARGILRLATSYLALPEKAHVAAKCYDRADMLYEKMKQPGWQAYVQALRATLLLQHGESEEAVSKMQIATILLQTSDDARMKCRVFSSVGSSYAAIGRFPVATVCLKQALVFAKQQAGDNQQLQATLLSNIASLLTLQAHHAEAIEHSQTACAIFTSLGHQSSLAVTLANLGQAQLQASQLEDAMHTIQQAVNVARQTNDIATAAQCAETLAAVHIHRCDFMEARRCFRASLKSLSHLSWDVSSDVDRVVAKLRQLEEEELDAADLGQTNMSTASSLSTALQRIAPQETSIATQLFVSPNLRSVSKLSSESSSSDEDDCFDVSSDLSLTSLEDNADGGEDLPDGRKNKGMGKIAAARTNRRMTDSSPELPARNARPQTGRPTRTALATAATTTAGVGKAEAARTTTTPKQTNQRPEREARAGAVTPAGAQVDGRPPALDLSTITNKQAPRKPPRRSKSSKGRGAPGAEEPQHIAYRRNPSDGANAQLLDHVTSGLSPRYRALNGFGTIASGGLKLDSGILPESPPTTPGFRPRRMSSAPGKSSVCAIL